MSYLNRLHDSIKIGDVNDFLIESLFIQADREIAELKKLNQRALAMLKRSTYCPDCHGVIGKHHAHDCLYVLLISELEAQG